MMQAPLLARQPIYSRDKEIFGFELLFRNHADDSSANIVDGDQATSQLILHACKTIGLDKLVGAHKAFVNLTRPFLLGEHQLPRDDRIVFEVLEDIVADTALVNATRKLANDGVALALDDFVYSPEFDPLLEIADYVKIDLKATRRSELAAIVKKLRSFDVQLVAEKIETSADYVACYELGCDLFQGYYLAKPTVITALTPNGIADMDAKAFKTAG